MAKRMFSRKELEDHRKLASLDPLTRMKAIEHMGHGAKLDDAIAAAKAPKPKAAKSKSSK